MLLPPVLGATPGLKSGLILTTRARVCHVPWFCSTARFIKFREHNDAAKALEELGGAEVHGKPMRLSKAAAR